ncbi:MAG TPA: hypothetical protein VK023_07855 [Sphingobacterium bovisgrunnientis]|jgi:hypothetical protein|uniref:hypothetical protein n=1 Tax=Sphingobacterium bovisgrunnientis TaxID=1874697 RepID=UPI00135A35E9|nr:hypothetical protein [Sphingobacterium bovisgrunnientis]HLS38171.1 hypothetical protein [Sphingobacterium bovisgrunnientis]
MEAYRIRVIESLQLLGEIRNQLFTQIVNIASDGELKEILDVFEEGDYYDFEMDQFENSSDVNILKLMQLCKNIEMAFDSIQNVNAVGDEEIFLSAS